MQKSWLAAVAPAIALWSAACSRTLDLPPPPGPGSISGRLVVAVPGVGETQPAAGASVRLLHSDVAAVSNADGRFVLAPILDGTGTVLIQYQPQADGTFALQRLLQLSELGARPGLDLSAGDLLLRQNATVRGRALRGDHQGETTGQQGTTVFVPEGPFTATTGDDGSWVLADVPEGQVTLAFFRDGYAPAALDAVQVRAGESLTLRDVVLAPAPAAAGTVTVAGHVRFSPPLADASVATVAAVAFAGTTTLPVSAAGDFTGALGPALYELRYSAPGYTGASVPNLLIAPGTTSPLRLPEVTLSQGQASLPDAGVTSLPPAPPDARIASPAVGAAGRVFTLDATGSSGAPGHALSYAWRQLAGQAVELSANGSAAAVQSRFLAPALPQTLQFELTVTDLVTGLAATAGLTVQLSDPPAAAIDAPAVVATGAVFQLDGSKSSAANASAWRWLQTAGDPVTLSSASAAQPSLQAPPLAQTLGFELDFSDTVLGLTATSTVQVVVADPPVARISAPAGGATGQPLLLDGSGSSGMPGHALTFSWRQLSGALVVLQPNDGTDAVQTGFTAPVAAQTLQFELTVTDAVTALSSTATTSVQLYAPPAAQITSPASGRTGSLFVLDGSASAGTGPLAFSWRQTQGDPVSLTSATAARPAFVAPLTAQALGFALLVTDTTSQLTASATTLVALVDAPAAHVSAPATAAAGSTVTLDASLSSGPAGHLLSYSWRQGLGDSVALSANDSPAAQVITFTAPATGQLLQFGLTVTDAGTGLSGTATAQVQIQVPPRARLAPVAPQPVSATVQLDATASTAAPGSALSFHWSAAPAVVFSANDGVSAGAPGFTAPSTPGAVTVTVQVTDLLSQAQDTAQVVVLIVQAPVAVIAPSSLSVRPGATFSLDGTGSGPPPLAFHWSVTPGAGAAIDDATVARPVLHAGTLDFAVSLFVTGPQLASATSTLEVQVSAGAVVPPSLTLPPGQTAGTGQTVVLAASATHPDPAATFTWAWTQTAGRPLSLLGAASPSVSFVAPAAPDGLVLSCTVTACDSGAVCSTATGTVAIDVEDRTPPHLVSTDPAVGTGSAFYARAVFDKDLDPTSVIAANLYVTGPGGAVPAQVSYDAPSRTATLLPDVPLTSGASYTLTVGAVTDLATPPNAHAVETVSYVVRAPQWRLWTSGFNASNAFPGIAVTPTEVLLSATRNQPGQAVGYAWFLAAGAGPVLADFDTFNNGLLEGLLCAMPTRRMHLVGAQAYAQTSTFICAGGGDGAFKRTTTGWAPIALGGQWNLFSDGTSLHAISTGTGTMLQTYLPSSDTWSAELINASNADSLVTSGTAGGGRLFVSFSQPTSGPTSCLLVQQRTLSGWQVLPEPAGAFNQMLTCMSGPVRNRTAFVAGGPLVVYLTTNNGATPLQLTAAHWSPALQQWTYWTDIAGGAVVTDFDVVARGDTIYLAYGAAGNLMVQRLDLAGAAPAFAPVAGPRGGAPWNDDLGDTVFCGADHPELFFAEDGLWATWQESCQSNEYRIITRRYSSTLEAPAAGADPATAAASCKSLHDADPSLPDGVYWLKPGAVAFPAFCDMSTDGGGWTLATVIYADFAHLDPAAVGLGGIFRPDSAAGNQVRGKLSDATINALKSGTDPAFRLTCQASLPVTGYFKSACTFDSVVDASGACTQVAYSYPPASYGGSWTQASITGLADGDHQNNNRLIYGSPANSGCNSGYGWGSEGSLWVR